MDVPSGNAPPACASAMRSMDDGPIGWPSLVTFLATQESDPRNARNAIDLGQCSRPKKANPTPDSGYPKKTGIALLRDPWPDAGTISAAINSTARVPPCRHPSAGCLRVLPSHPSAQARSPVQPLVPWQRVRVPVRARPLQVRPQAVVLRLQEPPAPACRPPRHHIPKQLPMPTSCSCSS